MVFDTHLQTYPSGSPKLIPPSLDKLDFTKLCAHAKQYRQKCGISEAAQQWWNDYLPQLQHKCSGHQQDHMWPLQDLIDSVKRRLPPPEAEIATHSDLEVDESLLPSHLQALYRKENGPHPEVINKLRQSVM